ncbi:MAG: GNAT family N-acetyltransferase [Hyphomicrobiales bacterium]
MTVPVNLNNHPPVQSTQPSNLLAVLGQLEVRLATSNEDIQACQNLRYRVFYQELDAKSTAESCAAGLDADGYDPVCSHLMVVDGQQVVGTYRLLRQEAVKPLTGFYSESEFDISPLLQNQCAHRFMELGRSCVLKPWRTKRVVELLWQGIWNYARLHHVDVMFGCASLEGTDPEALAHQLSFLYHHQRADLPWRAKARDELYVNMNRVAKDLIDTRAVFKELPPLIKGYLRLGAKVGDGAVIDHQFNTTDVLIVLPVAHIDPKYFSRFGAPSEKPDARNTKILSAA